VDCRHPDESVEKLIATLDQTDATAAIRSVWRLALARDPRALLPLKRLVQRASDPRLVREAQDAISQIEYACRRPPDRAEQ
jgi:hypothetical protein